MGSEFRAYPLPNAICSPPMAVLVGYLVWSEDLVRCLNQVLGGDLEAVDLRCVSNSSESSRILGYTQHCRFRLLL